MGYQPSTSPQVRKVNFDQSIKSAIELQLAERFPRLNMASYNSYTRISRRGSSGSMHIEFYGEYITVRKLPPQYDPLHPFKEDPDYEAVEYSDPDFFGKVYALIRRL